MLHDTPPVSLLAETIRALQNRRIRDERGQFWIEGIRNFVRACDARWPFARIAYSRILLKSDLAEKLARRLHSAGVARDSLTPEQFRGVSRVPRPSGIGAIVRQRWCELDGLPCDVGRCFLAIEHVRDAGNLGTILRTAEAAGVTAVIFVGPACDPFDPVAVRASMGGIFGVSLVRASFECLEDWTARRGVSVIGLSPRGGQSWADLPDDRPVVLALGEERSGLSARMTQLCRASVRLPIAGRADSLNVAVAAGIAMYEFVRRRG